MLTKKYAKNHTRDLIVNVIVKMTGTMLEVVLPAILAYIVDIVVPTENRNQVLFWGVIMVVCAFGAWVGNIVANRMAAKTAAGMIRSIRQDLFKRSMGLSARQIDKITISSLESRLTTDTYNLHRFYGASLRMGIRSVMLFLGGVFFCFWLSWRLALVLVVLVPPLMISIRMVLRKGLPMWRDVQRRIDDMVQVIRENIQGIKVSKALDKTDYEKARFGQSNDSVRQGEIDANYQMAKLQPIVNIILYGGLAVVLVLGAYYAQRQIVQAGTIIAFMSYFIQITNSLLNMNRMINMYNRSDASAQRIEEVLNMPLDSNQQMTQADEAALPESRPDVPEVEFRHVGFSYLNTKANVQDISFRLFPGQTLGIMGPTGAGKSTIIRLLLRQYDPTEGEILVRGVNTKHLSEATLHELFGVVFQNDFLFGDEVRKNIDFGRGLSDEELNFATENAQAKEFLNNKEGGLDFKLASKGVNLSGGQKQRLLLSRALAGNPKILILDDASSALDFRTDAKLRAALKKNYHDTTSILIAQRVSSVRHAEEIIFLDEGRVLAAGTHDELLATCPPYAEIAKMQMGETGDGRADLDMGNRGNGRADLSGGASLGNGRADLSESEYAGTDGVGVGGFGQTGQTDQTGLTGQTGEDEYKDLVDETVETLSEPIYAPGRSEIETETEI